MKKRVKVVLIVAAVLFAVGGVLSFATLASIGFDFTKLSTVGEAVKVEKALTVTGEENLVITVGTDDVRLSVSPDDQAHFLYYNKDFQEYLLVQENGEISLSPKKNQRKWYEYLQIDFHFGEDIVDVQLPASFRGTIQINASTGKVAIEKLQNLSELNVTASTGYVNCAEVSAGNIRMKTSTGDMRLEELRSGKDIDLICTTGRIVLSGAEAANDIQCKNSTGGLQIKNIKCVSAVLEATTGNIRFWDVDAQNISLHASTGDITGSVAGTEGDFAVTSSTGTGSNNLPEKWGSGSRTLTVKTSSGDIDVSFSH